MPAQPRSYPCPDCGGLVALPEGHREVRCPQCGSQLFFEDGLRRGGALVSAACPDCGAMTEYPEDASSVVCAYCGQSHLIAGGDWVARFHVPPRIPSPQAGAELVFVPYWRCRGLVYHFEMGLSLPPDETTPQDIQKSLGWSFPRLVTTPETVRRVQTTALDRSLRAAAFAGGLDSLGTRLSQVNQEPFDGKKLAAQGRVLDPSVPQDHALAAMTEGMYDDLTDISLFSRMEHGNLVGRRLSLIWYPYWVSGDGPSKTALDATGGGFTTPLGESAPAPAADAAGGPPLLIAARCPACAGPLPTDSFQSVRFCVSCQAAWRLRGGALAREPLQVVRPKQAEPPPTRHIPLWRLTISVSGSGAAVADLAAFRGLVPAWNYGAPGGDPKGPFHLYIPAWGSRLSPTVGALARRYTREQPALAAGGGFSDTARALYGPDEAAQLALIVLLSVIFVREDLAQLLLGAKLEIKDRQLLLLPCRRGAAGEWIDGVSGAAVLETELAEKFRT